MYFYFVFFIFYFLTFLLLSLGTIFSIKKIRKKTFWAREDLIKNCKGLMPKISLIIPAYNEEKTISNSIKSFLENDYPNLEIVVVNDGSKDKTLEILKRDFSLFPMHLKQLSFLPSEPFIRAYKSKLFQNLIVIDKLNGGKADALNCGINFANGDKFCFVDADVILPKESLIRLALPHIIDREVVATGGFIRLRNNCEISASSYKINLPKKNIERIQILEYLRAFSLGRSGWDLINGEIIISGAYGLFDSKIVRELGGFQRFSIGEDMEIVVRLHSHLKKLKKKYKIMNVPDAICWTEAPDNFKDLKRQRKRWQQGLLTTLLLHRYIFFNPKYGLIGLFVFPYFLFFELLSPFVETFGIFVMLFALFFKFINIKIFISIVLLPFLIGLFQNNIILFIHFLYFPIYRSFKWFFYFALFSFQEMTYYHYILNFAKIKSVFEFFSKFHLKGGWVSPSRI